MTISFANSPITLTKDVDDHATAFVFDTVTETRPISGAVITYTIHDLYSITKLTDVGKISGGTLD